MDAVSKASQWLMVRSLRWGAVLTTMQKSKQINVVYQWFRLALKESLRAEKGKIEKYMSNVQTNLYSQEFKILQSELLAKEAVFLNRYERICGKFSAKVVQNLKNCIVIYLNRLIHGLMTVSENLFNSRLRGMPSWPFPPNLISFKVGDLLRCRISSQQKEIIRLYEQIQQQSESNPQKIKIIRIKNRLKSGTNDLLINVRYNNSLIAQIQLKAKTKLKSSRFTQCSFKFSHFIYELQRSYFGPISEMCSIWVNLDLRSKLYQQLVQSQNLKDSLVKEISCADRGKSHQMEGFTNSPFICNRCGKSFSSDNYLLQHSKCKACSYFNCAICEINERVNKDLLEVVEVGDNIKLNLLNVRCDYLPARGIFISIENNAEGRVSLFKVIQILKKQYVFVLKNDLSFELAQELSTQKQVSIFVKDNIVYELVGNEPESLKKCTTAMAVTQFIMPLYVSRCYRFQKEAISLNKVANVQFSVPLMENWLKGSGGSKKFVKQLEVSSQNLGDLNFIPDDLVNLQFINVNLNKLTDLSALARFKRLQTIFCLSNNLKQFSVSLCSLPLKFLSIAENPIASLPAEFESLQSLEVIRFNKSGMKLFPEVITKLANLRQIHAYSNAISILPESIGNLKKLEILSLSQNGIETLPKSIEQLQSLQSLLLGFNKLKDISNVQFRKNSKLKEILLEKNSLVQIPSCLNQCHSLTKLDLNKNCIEEASFAGISLLGLKDLNLSNNKIVTVLSLTSVKSVITLSLNMNKIAELTTDIRQLKILEILDLSNNYLKGLPSAIADLRSLRKLMLSENQNIVLPDSFSLLKIQGLTLRGCGLKSTPKEITQLKRLKQLNISSNELKELPAEIVNLKQLEVLQMEDNFIKAFPAQLAELKNLKKIKYKQKNPCDVEIVLVLSLKSNSQQLAFNSRQLQRLPAEIPFNSFLEELDISRNNIRTIPETIKNLVNLRIFTASWNQLEAVPEGLFELKELCKMYLNKNNLTSLPDQFNKLPKLVELFIQDNKLTILPDSIQTIYSRNFKMKYNGNPMIKAPLWLIIKDTTSISIDLSKQQLSRLPQFSSLQSYQTVTAEHNFLREFQSLTQLRKLQVVNLSHNQITTIPSSIKYCIKLQHIQLSNNFVQELPAELTQIPLKILIVNHNPLRIIRQGFSKLKQLELRISPESFEALSQTSSLQWIQVKHLNLSHMELKHLSGHIGQIGSVEFLNLGYNDLQGLPEDITKIKGLEKLVLSQNRLSRLPESIYLWSELRELRAQNCQLRELPGRFGELVNLNTLTLSKNQLSSYPELSEQMILNSSIRTLQLNLNQFTAIPEALLLLPKLAKLNISNNKIAAIPDAIQSSNLQEFNLANNCVPDIPSFVSNSKIRAGSINLIGNPIERIGDTSENLINKLSISTIDMIAHLLPSPTDPSKQT